MCGRTDTAIVTDLGYLYSYNELENQSERFASYIDNRSVVAFLTSNSIECIVGYMGCLNNKIVPILLSESIHYEQLKIILDDYKPSYIWIPEKCKDNFINYQQIYRMNNYVLFKLNNLRVELNDKLALLLSTSGSTGSSKLVRISYENIQTNTKSIIKALDIKKGDRAITVLPFNYTYGLSVINTHLYMGATILLTNIPVYKKEFWDFFSKYGGTSFSGVPYTYEMLIKLRLLNKFPTSVRAITQAGGSLDIIYQKEISEYAVEKNIEFYVMYGQTEATARIACMRLDNDMQHIGSVGKFIYGINGEISDTGELVVHGKSISMGYAENSEDLCKGDDNKGVLHTGDIATMDEKGYIYWKGRKDRNKKNTRK